MAVARKIVSGSPTGQPPERTRATARVCHGCRGSFGRRPESCFEKQRASSQRQNYGSERERRAPPRLHKALKSPLAISPRRGNFIKTNGCSRSSSSCKITMAGPRRGRRQGLERAAQLQMEFYREPCPELLPGFRVHLGLDRQISNV